MEVVEHVSEALDKVCAVKSERRWIFVCAGAERLLTRG
jgi:hypothetical protein